jgi:hypothetical protein
MPVAPVRKRRFAIAKESAFEIAGAYGNPSAYHGVTVDPGREMVPRDEHLNSFGDTYPDTPGVQTGQVGVLFDACHQTYADLKNLWIATLGQEDPGGDLTLGGGTNNDSQVSISAGTPGKIVEITANNGGPAVRFLVPIKNWTPGAPGTAVYAIKLPAGYVNVTAVKNLSQLAGGVFDYVFGTAADTFSIEVDRAGASRQIPYRFQGCAITEALFRYELRKRLSFGFTFQASKWAEDPGGLSIADPAVGTTPFMSFAGDWALNDLATPAVRTPIVVKKLEFGFAPKLVVETGSRGLDGSFANLAGSDITGYTRDEWVGRLKLTFTYPDKARHTDLVTDVKKQLFGSLYPGKPGRAAAVNRQALWFHELILTAEPKLVEVDGGEAQEAEFNIGRDPSLGLAKMHWGMSNT